MSNKPASKIFMAYHLPEFPLPQSTKFIPFQVGSANYDGSNFLYHHDAMKDDNMSKVNTLYSELTMQYHMWKHELTEDTKNIGICHYRRLFNPLSMGALMNRDIVSSVYFEYNKGSRPLIDYKQDVFDLLTSDKTITLLDKLIAQSEAPSRTMITLTPFVKNNKWSIWTLCQLGWIPVRTIIEVHELLKYKLSSDDFDKFNKSMNESNEHFCNNMIYCSKELFAEYSKWLFEFMFMLESILKKLSIETKTELITPRMFGYISEYLLKPWTVINNINVVHVESMCFDIKRDTRI